MEPPTSPPAAPAPAPARGAWIATAAASALGFAVGFVREGSGDFHWHVVLGDWAIAQRAIYSADAHSFTFSGRPMSTVSWLGDVILAALFRAGGYPACFALRGALIAGWLVLLAGSARLGPRGRVGAAAAGLLALAAVWPTLYLRPEMFGLFSLALTLWAIARFERSARIVDLWPAAPALVLWANTHGSLPIGLAAIGLACAERGLIRLRRGEGRAALPVLLAPLALVPLTFLAPSGPRTPILFLMVDPDCASQIEWAPLRLVDLNVATVLLVAATALCAALAFRRASPWRLALAALLLLAALEHRRVLTQAIYALSFALAHALPGARATLAGALARLRPGAPRALALTTLLAWSATVPGIALLAADRVDRELGLGTEPGVYPEAACAFARDAELGARVLNDFNYGSYLMFCLEDRARVAIDQRVCSLYDGPFYRDYQARQVSPREVAELADDLGADWAFVANGGTAEALAKNPARFGLVYADDLARIYVDRRRGVAELLPSLEPIDPVRVASLDRADAATLARAEAALDVQRARCPGCRATRDAEVAVAIGRGDRARFEQALRALPRREGELRRRFEAARAAPPALP